MLYENPKQLCTCETNLAVSTPCHDIIFECHSMVYDFAEHEAYNRILVYTKAEDNYFGEAEFRIYERDKRLECYRYCGFSQADLMLIASYIEDHLMNISELRANANIYLIPDVYDCEVM